MFGEKDFTRTQIGMAKPIYYGKDGTGRDSYISFNNGGLNRPADENIYEIGSFNQRHVSSYHMPRIEPKKVYYSSNGLGRDSYIVSGSGGLVNSGHLRDIYTNGFLDTLRTSRQQNNAFSRCRSVCKTKKDKEDYYTKTQSFSNWKQLTVNSTFKRYQRPTSIKAKETDRQVFDFTDPKEI